LKTRRTTPKVALHTEVEFTKKKGYIKPESGRQVVREESRTETETPHRKQTAEQEAICIEPRSGGQAASEERNTEVAAPKWKETAEGVVIRIDPEVGRLVASVENYTEVATTTKVSTPKGGE
jgi:hypothetical protein